jgi:hypothetical protein
MIKPRLFLLVPALILAAVTVPAQETEEPVPAEQGSYSYFERDGDAVRFTQHFSWEAQSYVRRYEISVEAKEADGSYTELARESTEDNFIEFSLPVGLYRYRVQVYDLLGRPAGEPQWIDVEILPAIQPEIADFSPRGFYLDEDYLWEIDLRGENFLPRSELYLRSIGGNENRNERRIVPARYIPASNGRSAKIEFAERQLVPGRYELYTVNPGGLENFLGGFTIAYQKPFDFNLSLGWLPAVSTTGEFNAFVGKPFHPLGFGARASFMFFKRPWGYFGTELAPSYFYVSRKDGYNFHAHIPSLHLNAVFQEWFPNRIMAVNFRIGAGLTLMYDVSFDFGSAGASVPFNTLLLSMDGGVSFLWFIRKPFFLEAGIEYLQVFSTDSAWPGYVRPFISIGRQF